MEAYATLATAVFGFLGIVIQEARKRKTENYYRHGLRDPVRIGPKERRNSMILVGLGGTGKTTLIRSLIRDPKANPDERTEHYELYHGAQSAKGDEYKYLFFISDYKGQDIATLVGSFIAQQLKLYSAMAYGHVQTIILMVDLVSPRNDYRDPDPQPVDEPDPERIKLHIEQWSELALDAVKGLITDDSLRHVCLFINKVDLIRRRGQEADEKCIKKFDPLRERLIARFGNRVHVILGSTRAGTGLVELENSLRQHSVDQGNKARRLN
jgi:GTPase SAR1 family protein